MDTVVEAPVRLPRPDFREGLRNVDPEFVRILGDRETQIRSVVMNTHGINSPDYKPYHGEDPKPEGEGHINRVAERNVLILQTYFDALPQPKSDDERREQEEMLVFAHYLGIVHDKIQKYKFVEVLEDRSQKPIEGDWKQLIGKTIIKRQRDTGQNERDTIEDELRFMDKFPDIFNEKHKDWLRQSLIVTIPGWDPTGATVFQPELEKVDPELPFLILVYGTAWADLKGGTFMGGYEEFFKDGDLNLLEDYPDILEVAMNPESYSPEVIEKMGERIRKWRDDQVPFTEAQWNQLQNQIELFPLAKIRLREEVFKESTYMQTHQKVQERAEQDKNTPSLQLLAGLRDRVEAEERKYPKAEAEAA